MILPGNAACPGCPETLGLKLLGEALKDKKAVLVVPAGCSAVIQGLHPKSGFNVSTLNIAFAAGAAAAAGLAAGFEMKGRDDVNVIVWAGDGGTADIGLQALSGAAERDDNILFICVDNEAYMNTGIQRSGLTPYGAWTTTTWKGKKEPKKPIPEIVAAHRVKYVATASIGYPKDFIEKVRRAVSIKGFKYIHLLAPCPTGWRFDPSLTVYIARLAVECGIWPLYEVENGVFKLSAPSMPVLKGVRKSVREYIKLQGRFKRMSETDIDMIEKEVEETWKRIKEMVAGSQREL